MAVPLRIAVVYPDLLGTYGDGGNGLVLARRAEWRGFEATLLQASSDRPLPEADVYCLGGGEDGPQVRAARTLIDDGMLARRVEAGAVVLAVCAGFQVVGRRFPGAAGSVHEGVGLLDIDTVKGPGPRAVGEVLVEVDPSPLGPLPVLTGFENHGGATSLGDGTLPLGQVLAGVGNGGGDGTEGAVQGRVRRDIPPRSRVGPQPGPGRPPALLGARRHAPRTAGRRGVGEPARGAPRRGGGRRRQRRQRRQSRQRRQRRQK